MKKIIDKTFSSERALYNESDVKLINCRFEGEEDGESALKESTNVDVESTYMDLRYPFWHVHNLYLNDVEMTPNCRAALWYTVNTTIDNSKLHGIKAIRECQDFIINNCDIVSPEFSWRSNNINLNDSSIVSEYAFFESHNVRLNNCKFSGKYSFQYVENLIIDNSILDTKDAFWHAKNTTVKNSTIIGEYLGWYSENLTLINCKIKGTQPLCYCKGLKLIDCYIEDADLSFEYSEVDAHILGNMISIKNPLSGQIVVDGDSEIILVDSKYETKAQVTLHNKENK